MEQLYEIRGVLINYYKRYEKIINVILKFVVFLFVYGKLNSALGYQSPLNKISVTFLLSFISIFISPQWVLFLMILLISSNLFFISIETGIILSAIMLIVFILYVRVFPKMSFFILAVPLCFYLKIPLVVPIIAGLCIGLEGIVPVTLGVLTWSFGRYLPSLLDIKSGSLFDMPQSLSNVYMFIVKSLAEDKLMIMTLVIFISIIAICFIINKLVIDYSVYIAIFISFIVNIVGLIMGVLMMNVKTSIIEIIFESLLSIIVVVIIQFFRIVLDYNSAERVQFEDDDYYYYVKAIPKIRIEKTRRNIKKITSKSR